MQRRMADGLTYSPRSRIVVTSEHRRRVLYEGVAGSLGTEVAEALMEMLPPAGWSELATRRDVGQASALLRGEMATLTSELRGEMATLKGELRADMGHMEARLRKDISDQTRTIMLGMCGTMAAVVGAFAGLLTAFAR